MAKDIDVVVFGATGFTGRLVVDYLAREAPRDLRLAIAGRDAGKLDEIREHARARTGREIEMMIARADEASSLREMAARSRTVLTTVGPYALHGEPVVAACVAEKADYVDITGEPGFVDAMIARYGAAAREAGVRIVHCCGFDSIPYDLGVYFTMKEMRPQSRVAVEGFIQASGGISGGTWQSALGIFGTMREPRRALATAGSESLGSRVVRSSRPRPKREPEVSGWALPFASIDPQIVSYSARVLDFYGPDFTYAHFIRVGSLPKAAALGAGVGAVMALAQIEPARELMKRLKRSGEGPTEEQRAKGFFRVTFIARADGDKTITRVSGGEPGYSETAKMLSESALALVLDRDRLPHRAGVLTPALAFGDVLLDRLNAAGIRFEVVRRMKEAAA